MPAPVRIEAEAFGDPRFEVLGMLLGTSKFDALGRMAHLWSWCTERERHDVPVWIAAVYFDCDTDKASNVVAAELGEWCDCTDPAAHPADCQHIRLRGTSGRTDWLKEHRTTKEKGGKARAATAARGPDGHFLPNKTQQQASVQPAADQQEPSTTSSSEPAESSALSMPIAISKKRERSSRTKVQVPADWMPPDNLSLTASERTELERFRNHHRSKGNTFVDIAAAWRNWLSRSAEYALNRPANGNGSRQPEPQRNLTWIKPS